MQRPLALLALAGFALLGAAPEPAPSAAALDPSIAAYIDSVGNASVGHGAPGLVIAVVRDGAMVYDKGFGLRNVEDQVPVDGQTRFPIGSNTKQFTATAILLLQDRGKLRIDDPLATVLPDLPHAREVTLRNLLTHTGGYAEFTELDDIDRLGARPATAAEVVATVARRPLGFVPGTKWQYSNTGYLILQMVIEKLSHERYADFIKENIFTPLGMTSSYVRTYDETFPDVATEYDQFALGPWVHAGRLDYTWFGAAGAIVSNAADLAKWNAGWPTLLSTKSYAQMTTPMKLKDGTNTQYGFGLFLPPPNDGKRAILHGGNTLGAATQDARYPDDHLSIIVLANGGRFSYNTVVSDVYRALVPPPPATPAPRPAPHAAPAKRTVPSDAPDPKILASAQQWLRDAIAGKIDFTKLRPSFRAGLDEPEQLAALRALASYGKLSFGFAGLDRRAPTTAYVFSVTTKKGPLLYLFSRDDNGQIAGVGIDEVLVLPKPPVSEPGMSQL